MVSASDTSECQQDLWGVGSILRTGAHFFVWYVSSGKTGRVVFFFFFFFFLWLSSTPE
jgi:hypothetical protein